MRALHGSAGHRSPATKGRRVGPAEGARRRQRLLTDYAPGIQLPLDEFIKVGDGPHIVSESIQV